MVFIKLKRGRLARQSKASSHQCLGKPLCQGSNTTKHALTYTMVEISALLTTGCCCNTACGIRQHTQLQQRTKKQSRTGWQGIRWSSQLLWNSCLDRKLCCMSLCWPSPDRCQRHSGTELLAPWAAGPTQQVFLNRKEKSHSANFLHFCSFSNIRAKPIQADVHGEGGPVAGSQLHQPQETGFLHAPACVETRVYIHQGHGSSILTHARPYWRATPVSWGQQASTLRFQTKPTCHQSIHRESMTEKLSSQKMLAVRQQTLGVISYRKLKTTVIAYLLFLYSHL